MYASFFEWWFHKYLFHTPKLIRRTFNSHTLTHHQIYKGDHTYYVAEGKEPEHVAMDWWALILFLGVHFPIIYGVAALTHTSSLWGGLAAIAVYYGVYEYFHWCMHVPNQRPFEKWAVYRFIREHHRIHHVHMQKNLNVILPLADLVLGTYKRETKREAPTVPTDRRTPTRTSRSQAQRRGPAAAPGKNKPGKNNGDK
ncbi:MAG: fatty acid hydroxylase [Capsulimonas sp.]|uniref:fatty acid hydroxylase n=1 Tax=Capsulimonas sp. TaxID=2494211 RepID=UPI0032679F38